MTESKSSSQASNSNQNNLEYNPMGERGEIAPCPPSEVPLAGFLLIFQYIAVTKYYFFSLQSIGMGTVTDTSVKQLESGENINKVA